MRSCGSGAGTISGPAASTDCGTRKTVPAVRAEGTITGDADTWTPAASLSAIAPENAKLHAAPTAAATTAVPPIDSARRMSTIESPFFSSPTPLHQ